MNKAQHLTAAALLSSLAAVVFRTVPVVQVEGRLLILFFLFSVPVLYAAELYLRLRNSVNRRLFFSANLHEFLLFALFLGMFALTISLSITGGFHTWEFAPLIIVIVRNGYVLIRQVGRVRKFASFVVSFARYPAQTTIVSFLTVIGVGAVLLMMPFTTVDEHGLAPLDALFTATSAVCVTGLIVVDTATTFTFWGHVVILALIQIGGLGIMMLSFFVIFLVRRSIRLEEKLLVSYILSENDMTSLRRTLLTIVSLTFGFEAAGALLLYASLAGELAGARELMLFSVFHAVSAFCNAGFALWSDSLEGFRNRPGVLLTIGGLIVTGGLSFTVIMTLLDTIRTLTGKLTGPWKARHPERGRQRKRGRLQGQVRPQEPLRLQPFGPNTKLVLAGTAILLVLGTLLTYALEQRNTLRGLSLGDQYLNAFFQSIVYRTAGFNSLPFNRLTEATWFIVIGFMFVGGASGSTAGGIKLNTAAVILSFIRSSFRGSARVTLYQHEVPAELVTRAFLILILGLTAVFCGTALLTFTEDAQFIVILFECVSAFGTVGLSAGLTPALSAVGKVVIIVLMFMGRLGPLTLVAAVSIRGGVTVEYPRANLLIG